MKVAKALLALLAVLALAAPAAQATVIDFDDRTYGFLPADGNYKGFNWSGQYGVGSWVMDSQFHGAPHSGSKLAWTNGGADVWMTGPSFTADSLWMRTGYGDFTVSFTGYASNLALFTHTAQATTAFQKISLGFAGIDKLHISSGQRNLVLDDIEVNAAAEVPEPGTVATLLAGLALLGVTRRKFKSA